jgi:class 3 adenylate cyclase
MKATKQNFSLEASDERIRHILELADNVYTDSAEIPDPDSLTYDNGFHVDCAAVFIDIRGSSGMAGKHSTPVLGKIYRAYISECIAVLNQDPNCGEIFIQGDCVGAVFHVLAPGDVDSVFVRIGELNSLIEHLNWRLGQKSYPKLKCGIGMAVGRALMIKAGFKGSGINDVVWMGEVVNEAAKLCHLGSRSGSAAIQVSPHAYDKLSDGHKKLLTSAALTLLSRSRYEGNFVSHDMASWTAGKSGASEGDLAKLGRWLGLVEDPPPGSLRNAATWL